MSKFKKRSTITTGKNPHHIEVLSIKENKDGSATIQVDMSDSVYAILFREGLRLALPKKYSGKIKILDPDDAVAKELIKNKIRTVEIPDDEAEGLINLAVNDCLRRYIKLQDGIDKWTIKEEKDIEVLHGKKPKKNVKSAKPRKD